MIEWLNMDGDGIYVWPCYVLTLIVLVANVWVAKSQHGSLLKRAAARAKHSAQVNRRSVDHQPADNVEGTAS